jgi:hypothetical protein
MVGSRSAVLAALMLICVCAASRAQEDSPTSPDAIAARKAFDASVSAARDAYSRAFTSARQTYLDDLRRELRQPDITSAQAIAIDDEIKSISAGGDPAANPALKIVSLARARCESAGDRARAAAEKSIDAARDNCIRKLKAAQQRWLPARGNDLAEVRRIQAEITLVQKPLSLRAANSPPARVVDLLALLDVDADALEGNWRSNPQGVHSGPVPVHKRIRIPYHPPQEYDFRAQFTVLRGNGDVNLICSARGRSFAFLAGAYENSVAGFGLVDGRVVRDNATVNRAGPFWRLNQRHAIEVRVRHDEITGLIDGKVASHYRPSSNFADLDIGMDWTVGVDVLGIGTLNETMFHSVEVVEISGPGQPITRFNPRAAANPLPARARYVSLLDYQERAFQVGWGRLTRNSHPSGHITVPIDGKPCEKYLFDRAPSSIIFDIPAGAIGFRAIGAKPIFIDGARCPGSYRYCVDVDAAELFVSPSLSDIEQTPIAVSFPPGSRRLELRVNPLHDATLDHAVWAFPEFVFPDR